ncbi:MAG: hypothetical protein LWW95_08355 [Candidatus Desulfofervidus auxilii]|nr:hypothetical protein [Candidatus Desulfofervidus auxilii]
MEITEQVLEIWSEPIKNWLTQKLNETGYLGLFLLASGKVMLVNKEGKNEFYPTLKDALNKLNGRR